MTIRGWFHLLCVSVPVTLAPLAVAQQWEVGALGGGGFYLNKSVTGSRGTGTVGFRPGYAAGGWLAHTNGGRFGGEIRYLFAKNDLKLASGGTTVTFSGQSHVIHYDFVVHKGTHEDAVRPFFAVGGGLKGYFGTGTERAFQPLNNVAILTHTQQWQPMFTIGGGVKWNVGGRWNLRAEVRDYVTGFPKDVILPTPGNKVGGLVHDIVPMFGISYIIY